MYIYDTSCSARRGASAMELTEDDVFFADLSKQIALLINDDEEDIRFPAQCPDLSFQQRVPLLPQTMLHPAYAGGSFDADYRTGCKGTGVFIPRPRRKTRAARANCSIRSNSNSNSNSNSSTRRLSLGK